MDCIQKIHPTSTAPDWPMDASSKQFLVLWRGLSVSNHTRPFLIITSLSSLLLFLLLLPLLFFLHRSLHFIVLCWPTPILLLYTGIPKLEWQGSYLVLSPSPLSSPLLVSLLSLFFIRRRSDWLHCFYFVNCLIISFPYIFEDKKVVAFTRFMF